MIFQRDICSRFLPLMYAWRWSGLGDACQRGKMVTLLNSIFSVFKISPNYSVKYYDYIVKWCSGIACDWCALLDTGLILALTNLSHELK